MVKQTGELDGLPSNRSRSGRSDAKRIDVMVSKTMDIPPDPNTEGTTGPDARPPRSQCLHITVPNRGQDKWILYLAVTRRGAGLGGSRGAPNVTSTFALDGTQNHPERPGDL